MSQPRNISSVVGNLTFESTSTVTLGYLPANAFVTSVKVLVPTAGNAGGTDVIDVGLGGDADALANDVDVASTGAPSVTATANWGAVQSDSDVTPITAIYIPAATAPTAGVFKVVVEYAFI